jgi:hypothetical protein
MSNIKPTTNSVFITKAKNDPVYKLNDYVRFLNKDSDIITGMIKSICLAGNDISKNEYYHNNWKGQKTHAKITNFHRYIVIDYRNKIRIVQEGYIYSIAERRPQR